MLSCSTYRGCGEEGEGQVWVGQSCGHLIAVKGMRGKGKEADWWIQSLWLQVTKKDVGGRVRGMIG